MSRLTVRDCPGLGLLIAFPITVAAIAGLIAGSLLLRLISFVVLAPLIFFSIWSVKRKCPRCLHRKGTIRDSHPSKIRWIGTDKDTGEPIYDFLRKYTCGLCGFVWSRWE